MSTPEIVRAEQTHRLEGFRRWSRRHAAGDGGSSAVGAASGADGNHPQHRRPTLRPVLGR